MTIPTSRKASLTPLRAPIVGIREVVGYSPEGYPRGPEIRALLVGSRIDTRKLVNFVEPDRLKSNDAAIVFVFRYGVVVFCGTPPAIEDDLLARIRPQIIQPLDIPVVETAMVETIMAKTPTKQAKAAPSPAINDVVKKPSKSSAMKPVKAEAKPTAKTVAKPAAKVSAAKPPGPSGKTEKVKTKKSDKSPPTVAQLAADILADRILPTIEQIKAIALHAIGQNTETKKKSKKKKDPK
jgi:hypothetical protein